MKRKAKRLKNSSVLKFIMPDAKDDKRESPKIKIMTQTLTIGQARQLTAKVNKFIELAS